MGLDRWKVREERFGGCGGFWKMVGEGEGMVSRLSLFRLKKCFKTSYSSS